MANHKSAIKRIRQSADRNLRNRAHKSKMKTAIKAVFAAIEEQSAEKAQAALRAAIPVIDHVAVKGAVPKKTASRKVSRLTKRVNAFVAGAQA
ncbi:MAG: 30S ribosomal protein S20 [Desulfobacteraceae bacterium]|nr:30S ribosomal protein S20 [Desulfobacteraceae bacterium]